MVSEKAIIKALDANGGNVSAAARTIGITRRGLSKRISESDALQEALEGFRDELLDEAIDQTKTLVNQGFWPAINKVLGTLGRKEGFSDRLELTGADGAPVFNITVGVDDKAKS